MKRRFQVFISSTYEDLKVERQSAVQSILKAGHIPAGMELFTAGDITQMADIERWIDESDLFLLILGARYGAIEPTTGKSYVELELDYAIKTGTPFFSVVISDEGREAKLKDLGTSVLESRNETAYREFRELVKSHRCSFFTNATDVKLAVFETLPQIFAENELTGWVSADDIDAPAEVSKQLARLSYENSKLRTEIERLKRKVKTTKGKGAAFDELFNALVKAKVSVSNDDPTQKVEISLLKAAIHYADYLTHGVTNAYGSDKLELFVFYKIASPMASYGLVQHAKVPTSETWTRLILSKDGVKFLKQARLYLEMEMNAATFKAPTSTKAKKKPESALAQKYSPKPPRRSENYTRLLTNL